MDDTTVTQEPVVEAEANQGEKEEVVTQEPIDDVIVTQEPTTKKEQLHPREVVTPSVDIAYERTHGPDEGWCSERIFLIP